MENGFIIIPDTILNDTELNAMEKLLLGLIIRLSQNGDCFASNKYFGELLGLYPDSVSRYIRSLKEKGYITTWNVFQNGTNCIEKRIIKIARGYCQKRQGGIVKNDNRGIVKNDKDNNTIDNIQFNIYGKKNTVKKGFKNYTENDQEDALNYINKIYKKYGDKLGGTNE